MISKVGYYRGLQVRRTFDDRSASGAGVQQGSGDKQAFFDGI